MNRLSEEEKEKSFKDYIENHMDLDINPDDYIDKTIEEKYRKYIEENLNNKKNIKY